MYLYCRHNTGSCWPGSASDRTTWPHPQEVYPVLCLLNTSPRPSLLWLFISLPFRFHLCLKQRNAKLKNIFRTVNLCSKIPCEMSSWRKTLFSLLASVSCLEPQFGAGGRSKQLLNCEPAQDGLWPLCLQTCPWVAIRMAGCVQLLLFLLVLYPAEPSGWCLLLVSSWTVWVWLGGFSKDRGAPE